MNIFLIDEERKLLDEILTQEHTQCLNLYQTASREDVKLFYRQRARNVSKLLCKLWVPEQKAKGK